MEGAREGKGRGMKFTIQRNLFKQQLIGGNSFPEFEKENSPSIFSDKA